MARSSSTFQADPRFATPEWRARVCELDRQGLSIRAICKLPEAEGRSRPSIARDLRIGRKERAAAQAAAAQERRDAVLRDGVTTQPKPRPTASILTADRLGTVVTRHYGGDDPQSIIHARREDEQERAIESVAVGLDVYGVARFKLPDGVISYTPDEETAEKYTYCLAWYGPDVAADFLDQANGYLRSLAQPEHVPPAT